MFNVQKCVYFKELGGGSWLVPLFHLTLFFTNKFAQHSFLQHGAIGSWNPRLGQGNTVRLWDKSGSLSDFWMEMLCIDQACNMQRIFFIHPNAYADLYPKVTNKKW